MAYHPSFLYDQYRPGVETDSDGRVWNKNRDILERIIHSSAREVGAVVVKTSYEDEKPEGAKGDVMLMSLTRQEPPMTTEEALQFGGQIVIAWGALAEFQKVPDFCDAVFRIPQTTDTDPTMAE